MYNPHMKVLQLNKAGTPIKWISPERAVNLYFTDKIVWSMSDNNVIMRGGTNRMTGMRSILEVHTIIAVKGEINDKQFNYTTGIKLDNTALFERDKKICAYCGERFKTSDLTRDHVIPTSKGGRDVWTNVVTSCSPCNTQKSNKFVDGKNIKLLYVPYKPCRSEMLILANRNILADQQEFLMAMVEKNKKLN